MGLAPTALWSPPPPLRNWRTLPSTHRPSTHRPSSLHPPTSWLFLQCSGRGGLGWRRGGGARGWRGRALQASATSGARPTSGAIREEADDSDRDIQEEAAVAAVANLVGQYHWRQKDYRPNLYSRRVILGNSMFFPRQARDLISKIRSCTVRSDLKNKQKTAENALFLRSDLKVQDRILEIRSLASLCFVCTKENFWGNKC